MYLDARRNTIVSRENAPCVVNGVFLRNIHSDERFIESYILM